MLIKIKTLLNKDYFIKKILQHRCFRVNIAKFLRKTFFRTPPAAASSETRKFKCPKQILKIERTIVRACYSLDQYNVRNNLEIQIIYVNVSYERLEEKVIYIFNCLDIDVEGVHIGYLLHDEGPYHVEISSLICSASQLNGFYVIGISVIKEVMKSINCFSFFLCLNSLSNSVL